MAQFLPLTVTHIHRTIRDAVVLTLRAEDPEAFRFIQGQYLTFRHRFDGTEIRRNYSICAGLDDGRLQVGIKRVDGGAFSTFANERLAVGDVLEAMPPMGRFYAPIEPARAKRYLGFAGGSGITPVLSILRTALAREPLSHFTLLYANRAAHTIMFREELEDLKNQYMGRFTLIHVLETGQDIDLFSGRLEAEKLGALFAHWVDVPRSDLAFICGPEPMMLTIAEALKEHGMDEAAIKYELFGAQQQGQLARPVGPARVETGKRTKLRVQIDGTGHALEMAEGQSVLETALAADLDAPYACKAGVCSTCKAKLLAGEAQMLSNHALEDYEVERGYILTCQAYPLSDTLAVDYDQH